MLSPDDRWIAYVSNESGQEEAYVRPFPDLDRKWPVSVDGGAEPLWSRHGTELFYRHEDKMMAVAVSTDGDFHAGTPRALFEGDFGHARPDKPAHYDVHPDGERFVMFEDLEAEGLPREIHVVLNWYQELERLVSAEN